ncbi:MAG: NUDIX hydrolase [Anaerolineaceae bacterium]
MNKFTLLNQQTVLYAHVFNVQKVNFRLPDGREHTYDLVDHPNAVTLLPINAQGEVYFVSQYRVGANDLLLELPAGVMDEGEEPAASARRELREEIGMDCGTLILLGGFYMAAGYSNEYMNVFLAMDLHPAPLQQDEDEFLELTSHPLSQVYQKAWAGEIKDGKTLATLLMALPEVLKRFPDLRANL